MLGVSDKEIQFPDKGQVKRSKVKAKQKGKGDSRSTFTFFHELSNRNIFLHSCAIFEYILGKSKNTRKNIDCGWKWPKLTVF